MTCKPRPISGNLPFDAIAKDYNRYCGRIVGNGGTLFGKVFFVREDGTATKDDAVGPSSDASACMSVATFNASAFLDYETVVFSGFGGNITSAVVIPSGGSTLGGSISYIGDSLSTPIFHGGGTVPIGLRVLNIDNVNITGMTLTNQLTSGWSAEGTSSGVVVSFVEASNSGNQGFQNLNTASVAYIGITGDNNVDDGFSMHNATTSTINGGSFNGNDQGINIIEDATLSAIDIGMSGNITYDIWLFAENISLTATIDNYNGDGRVIVQTGELTLNQGSTTGAVNSWGATATLNLNGFTVDGGLTTIQDGGTMVVDGCTFKNVTAGNSIDFNTAGTLTVRSSQFYGMGAAKFAITVRDGSTCNAYNNTIYGASNVGRGVFATAGATLNHKNNIMSELEIAAFILAGATTDFTNNCYYNNTTDYGSSTPTDPNRVTTDPLFISPTTDFSLGGGSDCIGAGIDIPSVTTDFNGQSFDSPPSIGSVEFQG